MTKLELIRKKIMTNDEIRHQLAVWRFKGLKIVFTNGCFDILHLGHIEYLSKASELGNKLILGLNTDDSVRRLKGPSRPVNNQEARSTILAAISFIDAIVLFDEDTPAELISHIRPDILVKGKDYDGKEIAGSDLVKSYGGRVETIELTQGYSTTGILEKKSLEAQECVK